MSSQGSVFRISTTGSSPKGISDADDFSTVTTPRGKTDRDSISTCSSCVIKFPVVSQILCLHFIITKIIEVNATWQQQLLPVWFDALVSVEDSIMKIANTDDPVCFWAPFLLPREPRLTEFAFLCFSLSSSELASTLTEVNILSTGCLHPFP